MKKKYSKKKNMFPKNIELVLYSSIFNILIEQKPQVVLKKIE